MVFVVLLARALSRLLWLPQLGIGHLRTLLRRAEGHPCWPPRAGNLFWWFACMDTLLIAAEPAAELVQSQWAVWVLAAYTHKLQRIADIRGAPRHCGCYNRTCRWGSNTLLPTLRGLSGLFSFCSLLGSSFIDLCTKILPAWCYPLALAFHIRMGKEQWFLALLPEYPLDVTQPSSFSTQ